MTGVRVSSFSTVQIHSVCTGLLGDGISTSAMYSSQNLDIRFGGASASIRLLL